MAILRSLSYITLHSIPHMVLVGYLSRVDELIERLVHVSTGLQMQILSEDQCPSGESDLNCDQEEKAGAELKGERKLIIAV